MRRFFLFLICCLLLTTGVHAAGTVTDAQNSITLSSDGTCQVTLILQLTTDGAEQDLRFPLPRTARDITLNGKTAKTHRENDLRWVELSELVYGPGSYHLTLHYTLPDLVILSGGRGLLLQLPLLSGFDYPIDRMNFSIVFPGEPTNTPVFSSTYHPESMDSLVDYSVSGNTISGSFAQGLKDHESVTMTLPVTGELFPQPIVKQWSLSDDDMTRYALTLVAILYWIFFLRCPLPKRIRRLQAPGGITAGELGCCLTGQGVDFPMMVLSWAQMGYLTIQLDRNNRVFLLKNMDMGNERSDFEMRCFKTLFGKRRKVDAGGDHFARLGRKAGKTIAGSSHYFQRNSGSPLLFRCLAAGIGAAAGVSLAVSFATDTVWQVLLSVVLVPFGGVSAWVIQSAVRNLLLRRKQSLLFFVIACLLWLVLGNWAGEWNVAIYVIVSQFLAGIFSAHGSRRTEAGLQARNEILGLRRYLKSIPGAELSRILRNNPDYYFLMAPDAMALGVDNAFARQFGNLELSACPYLLVEQKNAMTARQWNELLRKAVKVLDERQEKQLLIKILGK